MNHPSVTCGSNIKTQSINGIEVGEKRNNQTEKVFKNSFTSVVKKPFKYSRTLRNSNATNLKTEII